MGGGVRAKPNLSYSSQWIMGAFVGVDYVFCPCQEEPNWGQGIGIYCARYCTFADVSGAHSLSCRDIAHCPSAPYRPIIHFSKCSVSVADGMLSICSSQVLIMSPVCFTKLWLKNTCKTDKNRNSVPAFGTAELASRICRFSSVGRATDL